LSTALSQKPGSSIALIASFCVRRSFDAAVIASETVDAWDALLAMF
jgi:hypothetical protein